MSAQTPMDQFKVWIGCLACYNEGRLVGMWHDAKSAADVTTIEVHAAEGITVDEEGYLEGVDRAYGPHEELWCFDVETPPGIDAKEMSPDEATRLHDEIDEAWRVIEGTVDWEVYALWAEGEEIGWHSAKQCQENYLAATLDEVVDELLEQAIHAGNLQHKDSILVDYFNVEAYKRDLRLELRVLETGHVFTY